MIVSTCDGASLQVHEGTSKCFSHQSVGMKIYKDTQILEGTSNVVATLQVVMNVLETTESMHIRDTSIMIVFTVHFIYEGGIRQDD